MPYQVISNFKQGLDTRKDELTSVPGSLESLINAHINQGGEIEKRKGFSFISLPTSTFGLVAVRPTGSLLQDFWTFGSVAASSLSPSMATPIYLDSPGTSWRVQYQRCQSPVSGASMTGVVAQTVFNDLPFIIASFSNGQNLAFYNGTLVADFLVGEAFTGITATTDLASIFKQAVNVYSPDLAAALSSSTVTVTTQNGVTASCAAAVTTGASGTITGTDSTTIPEPSGAAIYSFAQFNILGKTGGTIRVYKVDPSGPTTTELTSGAVSWGTSDLATAQTIAQAITSNSGSNGGVTATFTGSTTNASVILKGPVGTSHNGFSVKTVTNDLLMVGPCYVTFTGTGYVAGQTWNLTNQATGVSLTNGTVTYPGTTYNSAVACAAVIAAINAYTATSDYFAFQGATSSQLYFCKKTKYSTDSAEPYKVDLGGTVGPGISSATYANTVLLVISPNTAQTIKKSASDGYFVTPDVYTARVAGGCPPYTFKWVSIVDANGDVNFVPETPNYPYTRAIYVGPSTPSASTSGSIRCTVTDSIGNTDTATVPAIFDPT